MILGLVWRTCRRHPWMVLLYTLLLFIAVRNYEDGIERRHGNWGLVGLLLDALALGRWLGFLGTLVLVGIACIDIEWVEFAASWTRFTNAIVNGANIRVTLNGQGVHLDVNIRAPEQQAVVPQEGHQHAE